MSGFSFGAPFPEQLKFFRAKVNLPSARWDDIRKAAHDRAFIVAGAMDADLLQDLRDAVDGAISRGESLQEFRNRFQDIVDTHGWHGWTGEGTQAGFDWRTRVIYTTNLRASHAAGRYAQLQEAAKKGLTWWRYVHNDSVMHPRPLHQLWGDMRLTLRHDDPFWQTHFPPNGWGCRCRVVAEFKPGDGATTDRPDGWNSVDPKTGEPPGIDKGWGYEPGANVDKSLADFVEQKLIKLDGPLRNALAKALADENLAALEPDMQAVDLPSSGVNKVIAKAVAGQPTWKDLGLKDLRELGPGESAPALIESATSAASAVDVLRKALGVEQGGERTFHTPVGEVTVQDSSLNHVVEKRQDARERFANLIEPTLLRPTEVWQVAYDDGSTRDRFIKVFHGSKSDLLVMVLVGPDGSVFWNMMQRDRKGMNALRLGKLIYSGEGP